MVTVMQSTTRTIVVSNDFMNDHEMLASSTLEGVLPARVSGLPEWPPAGQIFQ
jgi:hypothetical protein